MTEPARHWLHFAYTDIKAAKLLCQDETLTQGAAFHCQQAVEKCFKSVLENHKQRIPKIHNLEVLYQKVVELFPLSIDMEVLQTINDIYIDSRYPGDIGLIPSGIPSVESIESFIDFSEKLYNEIYQGLS